MNSSGISIAIWPRSARRKTTRREGIDRRKAPPSALSTERFPCPIFASSTRPRSANCSRVDLELATRHYRPRGLAAKARAGFSLYSRPEDASRLRRILNDQRPHRRNPCAMNISPSHLDALESPRLHRGRSAISLYRCDAFGLLRGASIPRLHRLPIGASGPPPSGAKLHAKKHARTECFPKSGVIYHLFSRRLYRQIGRENLRNRREHEIEFIRQRIAMLDFVLANPGA